MGTFRLPAWAEGINVMGTIGPAGIQEMTGPSPAALFAATVEEIPLLGTAAMIRRARSLAKALDETVDIRSAIRIADPLQVEAQEVGIQVEAQEAETQEVQATQEH